jgi:NAD(P)-dependent dehydrogenase (short-subunit alcohol dehydrogenase family)
MKTILLTGATDGIGLATAKMLAPLGHHLLLHGRSQEKLDKAVETVKAASNKSVISSYIADLSNLRETQKFAARIIADHDSLDVLINNAGVFKTPEPITPCGLDVRFAVNTLAPFILTKKLSSIMTHEGRVINLSSAAQSPVTLTALRGQTTLSDMEAYAQSKLALTMWSRQLALVNPNGPIIVAVNPASLLGSKMVHQGFGVAGGDLNIGADILVRAALSDEFSDASGLYYDNDSKAYTAPHPDALDEQKCLELAKVMDDLIEF